MAIMM